MSDPAEERASLRRYAELPVWVVEDHQEVSGRAAAGRWGESRGAGGGGGGGLASGAREETSICYPLELHCRGGDTNTAVEASLEH